MRHERTTDAARGRWCGILANLGMRESYLSGKRGPCPCCAEGKDCRRCAAATSAAPRSRRICRSALAGARPSMLWPPASSSVLAAERTLGGSSEAAAGDLCRRIGRGHSARKREDQGEAPPS